ncbi:MAG: hypothetical protein ABI846_07150 [Rudaea sp.]
MRTPIIALLLAASAPSALAGTVYQVDLANKTDSGVVSIETARGGSDRFHRTSFATRSLRHGNEAVSFQLRRGDDGCVRDLRIGFADGRVLTHRGFDLCNAHGGEILRDSHRVADTQG